jgi:hypothetical protein
MEFKIKYKDHLGRTNQTKSTGKDSIEAEKKFKTLYPDCNITEISKEELIIKTE